jgi:hypothetical protein
MREETLVVQFKVLSRHLNGGTKGKHNKAQDSLPPDRDLNSGTMALENTHLTKTLFIVYFTTFFQQLSLYSVERKGGK